MPEFNPQLTITNRITAGLTQIERARGFHEAATLSEVWIREMGQRALLLEVHHTTHIEGTRLTLEQAERLLAGETVPNADPDDARELLNYRRAFEFVSGYLASGSPITEGLIREIHKHLVEGIRGGSAAPGEYRRVQYFVVNSTTSEPVYTPPPSINFPAISDLLQRPVVFDGVDDAIVPRSDVTEVVMVFQFLVRAVADSFPSLRWQP